MAEFWLLPVMLKYQCLTRITYEVVKFLLAKVLGNTIGYMAIAVLDQVLELLTTVS
jgi:hypothetical protein